MKTLQAKYALDNSLVHWGYSAENDTMLDVMLVYKDSFFLRIMTTVCYGYDSLMHDRLSPTLVYH